MRDLYDSMIKRRSGNHHKDVVIKRILDAGLEVRKEIVASFDLEIDAFAYEWFLINTVYGLRNLTNMTTGGIGHAVEDSPRLLGVPDEMITEDVAHYLNVHRKTVINLVERGELRGCRVGRNWRFRKSDVDEYLERQRSPNPVLGAAMVRWSINHRERYYVYALAYPQDYYDKGNDLSGIVFYIGKGTDNRIDSHEMEAGNRSSTCYCKKCKVIRRIWADGKQVQKYKLLEEVEEPEAFAFERRCIQDLYAGPYLINTRDNPLYYEQERTRIRERFSHPGDKDRLDQTLTSQEVCKILVLRSLSGDRKNYAKVAQAGSTGCSFMLQHLTNAALGVEHTTLLRYVKAGRIRKYRKGIRNVVFSRADVERLKRQLEEVHLINNEE